MRLMKICGLQKTTLLDYPQHVAATIFMGGCNFRCPFCHNSDLLGNDAETAYTPEEVLSFLKKRVSLLEGVCITGGEPTLQPDLESFIRDIRGLGYLIKLDTNGYLPKVLKDLAGKGLLDCVAMDIKSSKEGYPAAAGVSGLDLERIDESVRFLMEGSIPYEFRTTVVRELHSAEDFRSIGQWLHGCSHYYLQNYQESDRVLLPGFSCYTKDELLEFIGILKQDIQDVGLRGIDY